MRSTLWEQRGRGRSPSRRLRLAITLLGLLVLLLACEGEPASDEAAQAPAEASPGEPSDAQEGRAGEQASEAEAEPSPHVQRDAGAASEDHRSWSAEEDAAGSEPDDEDEPDEPDGDEDEPDDPLPLEGVTIALDPGHNGANAEHPEEITRPVDAGGLEKQCNTVGASTPDGVTESEIVFDVSVELRDRLEAQGATVSMTREDDEGWGPCIDERGQHAQEAGADVLVSVHADGGPPEGRGFHVIHPGEVPGYNDGLVEPSADLARDLRDALQQAERPPATYVGTDGLHQRADIGTLNHADVPAVMVEVGNLRHAEEAALLTDDAGQETVAEALEAGILAHLEEDAAAD